MKIIQDSMLFEQAGLLVINKQAGIPVQGKDANVRSLLEICTDKWGKPLYPIHRLDQPVSGLVLLGLNSKTAGFYSKLFATRQIEKMYLAVVPTTAASLTGELIHYLKHDRRKHRTYTTSPNEKKAKEARLHYRILHQSDHYDLWEVRPQTGRFHQIRAQLAAMGAPIKGDVKYGARRGNDGRFIHLHARELLVPVPGLQKPLHIRASVPEHDKLWQFFNNLLENKT